MPWNPDIVFKKIDETGQSSGVEKSSNEHRELKTFLTVLKNEVGLETYELFENSSGKWEGELELKGLYDVWSKVTKKIGNLSLQ